MAYSNVGIANMALQRVGAKGRITSLTDANDPNAIKVNAVWEYIRDQVLEEVKPKFATLRYKLAKSATSPVNTEIYEYAYPLPADFLCLADDSKDDFNVYPLNDEYPYIIELHSDGSLALMCNYDNSTNDDFYITYVKKAVDPAKYSPSFVDALAFRLGAELSFAVPESAGKYDRMMSLYEKAKKRARGKSLSLDSLTDEKGSDSWESAGR